MEGHNYIAFLTFTSNLQCQRNSFNVVQVKTRLSTCLYNNEKKNEKYFEQNARARALAANDFVLMGI